MVRLSGSWPDGFESDWMVRWSWVAVAVMIRGRRLWSDGHGSWVRRSNGHGGGSAMEVSFSSFFFFFFFLLWFVSWFWFGVGRGSPILGLCVCDGFWFTDLVLVPMGFGSA